MSTLFAGFDAKEAVISECGTYRYTLTRQWDDGLSVAWLMFNPSTADAEKDDPTIRKCVGFSKRWGYGRMVVVNLFAYRSTDPKELLKVSDPVGPENARHIANAVKDADCLVCAWGCESEYQRMTKMGWRPHLIVEAVREVRPRLPIVCLGRSKSGNPYHPLMLAYETPRVPLEASRG